MISIVIADSQTGFRDSIRNLLSTQKDFEVIGLGSDGYEALELIKKCKPNVALLELELPILNAANICSSLKVYSPDTAVIVLVETSNDDDILQVIGSGISGYLIRSSVLDEISMAVRCVHKDGYHMSRESALRTKWLFTEFMQGKLSLGRTPIIRQEKATASLLINKAEMKIAVNVGEGWSNKQIAERMHLKESTVRNYVSMILQKTGLENRTQIAIYAINNGFAARDALSERGVKACKRRRAPSAQSRDPAQLEFQYEF
ncbi:MAG: response regulator transcription factor [Spirochaetaceae bacterium]|jgi:DNA-binding NarL/FixJ family response regulator|nr:response regulator transcription factor [Spirochaetaceae bacterium]